MSNTRETRTSRRKDKIHHEILEVASRLISEKGSAAVSLDEISRYADVARKTVYNHFENKEALIDELVMPVCDHARAYFKKIETISNPTLDDIWSYCLELWDRKELNSILLYQITVEDYANIKESKKGFIIMFSQLLKQITDYKKLSEKSISETANLIYDTYIPVLQNIFNDKNYHEKFRKAMTGLIQGALAPDIK